MINKFQHSNYIQLLPETVGKERKLEILSDILENSSFLPNTVGYKDIDEAFKEWADKELSIYSETGKFFPTFSLFSNQRFSEYSQSWQHVDENNNLLLNFKTVNRENCPKYGKIQSGLWNIPGDSFFIMKRKSVMDDDGTESFLDLKMKQPTAIDLSYKLNIITDKYQKLNEFNTLINKKFNSCQCYIWPNSHPMPMKLEGISDESQYNIDDRQYYCQSFQITVMAYLITEDDFRVEEVPAKVDIQNQRHTIKRHKASVDIEECDYFSQITIMYDEKTNYSKFELDVDFKIKNIDLINVRHYSVMVNNESVKLEPDTILHNKDIIKVNVNKIKGNEESKILIAGTEIN